MKLTVVMEMELDKEFEVGVKWEVNKGGDLLRSVLHIKFGDKIKSHRYLDKSG